MLKKTVSIDDVCALLNEMLSLDYECTNALVSQHIQCNSAIANHPTIQVQHHKDDIFPKIGLLGFLNGLFGIREDDMGAICMVIENDKILSFKPTPNDLQQLKTKIDHIANHMARVHNTGMPLLSTSFY